MNWPAIAAAAASIIAIGFLWYGPLFGSAWMKEMGVAPDFKPDPLLLKRAMLLMTVGALLTAWVLACGITLIWPAIGESTTETPRAAQGFNAGLVAWAGFYVPMLLGGRGMGRPLMEMVRHQRRLSPGGAAGWINDIGMLAVNWAHGSRLASRHGTIALLNLTPAQCTARPCYKKAVTRHHTRRRSIRRAADIQCSLR